MCCQSTFAVIHLFVIVGIAIFIFQAQAAKQQYQREIENVRNQGVSQYTCFQLCSHYSWQQGDICCSSFHSSSCQQKSTCFSQYLREKEDELSTISTRYVYQIIAESFLSLIFVVRCCTSKRRQRNVEHQNRMRGEAIMARLLLLAVRVEREDRLRLMMEERNKSLLTQSFIAEQKSESCAVCLDSFQQQRVVKLNCDHIFHRKCIQEWIIKSATCPVCRAQQ